MIALGIDIGGTGIKGAPVDLNTGLLTEERFRIDTPRPALPPEVAKAVKKVIDHFNWQGPIGCGFPTPFFHGKCKSGGNLHPDWKGVHVAKLFEETVGQKFTVINDADAAGLAEMNFGNGQDKMGLVIVITLGTGIGSGMFFNKHLIPNSELGHLLYKNKPFEKYAADSIRKQQELSYKKWGKRLNKYFQRLELLLSPDYFILGGGASKHFKKFEYKIKTEAPITPAENKNDAGIIGAALSTKETNFN